MVDVDVTPEPDPRYLLVIHLVHVAVVLGDSSLSLHFGRGCLVWLRLFLWSRVRLLSEYSSVVSDHNAGVRRSPAGSSSFSTVGHLFESAELIQIVRHLIKIIWDIELPLVLLLLLLHFMNMPMLPRVPICAEVPTTSAPFTINNLRHYLLNLYTILFSHI